MRITGKAHLALVFKRHQWQRKTSLYSTVQVTILKPDISLCHNPIWSVWWWQKLHSILLPRVSRSHSWQEQLRKQEQPWELWEWPLWKDRSHPLSEQLSSESAGSLASVFLIIASWSSPRPTKYDHLHLECLPVTWSAMVYDEVGSSKRNILLR